MQNCIIQCLSLLRIHQCAFITLQDGLNEVFYLTHPGLYRKRLVSTTHMDGGIVQYTHHSKIHSEMKRFVRMMKVCGFSLPLSPLTICLQNCLEKKDTCPFAVAAWIHSAFSRIHPFTVSVSDRIS